MTEQEYLAEEKFWADNEWTEEERERALNGYVTPLKYTDAETLFAEPLHRTDFIVQDILPQGVHLLCGAPKMGKSWLALWLAVQITNRRPVWDFETKDCGVLYLCLEDTENRVRERLHKLTDSVSENLHIAVHCSSMKNGLIDQLEDYLLHNYSTKLIIIDTLQKVRHDHADSNMYRADYTEISEIKEFADSHGIAVLLVHHLRKMPDESDPFNMISGSNGLSGAVDGMYLLCKDKRCENTARFLMTGRDIEMREFKLQFQNCKWELLEGEVEKPAEEEVPPVLESIERFMQGKATWVGTATELCAQLDVPMQPTQITRILSRYAETWLYDHNLGYQTSRSRNQRYLGLYTYVQYSTGEKEKICEEDLPF